jgi:hypothetical protein
MTLSIHAGIALNAVAALVLFLATPAVLHRMRMPPLDPSPTNAEVA